MDDTVKLIFKGWVEADDDEPYTNVPKKCPKCERKLHKTDALALCGLIIVICENYKCKWCEIFEE